MPRPAIFRFFLAMQNTTCSSFCQNRSQIHKWQNVVFYKSTMLTLIMHVVAAVDVSHCSNNTRYLILLVLDYKWLWIDVVHHIITISCGQSYSALQVIGKEYRCRPTWLKKRMLNVAFCTANIRLTTVNSVWHKDSQDWNDAGMARYDPVQHHFNFNHCCTTAIYY